MMNLRVLIMAAGTGGHVIPGLAIARELQSRGHYVLWLGTPAGMENTMVQDVPIERVTFTGLRGKGAMHLVKNSWNLLVSLVSAARIMRRHRIDTVVGMGGYICVCGGLVAWLTRRSLMLVNADAQPLLSTRLLRPMAKRIWWGLEEGNPVRAEIEALPAPQQRLAHRARESSGAIRVLVVGGSLGASAINECVPRALALIEPFQRPSVVHQSGAAHLEHVRALYKQMGLEESMRSGQIQVVPFIDDMACAYGQCDVFVGRSGAMTVSELCAAGVPSILIPFTVATTAHQSANARYMARQGAAVHMPQDTLTPQRLAQTLLTFTPSTLVHMAMRATSLAKPHAASRLVDALMQVHAHARGCVQYDKACESRCKGEHT